MENTMIVAVVGASQCTQQDAEIAEAIGRELARRGAILICGGRGGVMEAACRGAKAGGGQTVGILPGTSRHQANPYVDIPIVTGLGEARNLIIVRSADAVIAVGGEYGTLSEIAFALKLGVPVVGLDTWELSKGGSRVEGIVRVTSPAEAVERAFQLGAEDRDAISESA
jgi:uncharacterized protein (TIGR00725 family)